MRRKLRIFLTVLCFLVAVPSTSAAQTVYWDATHGTYLQYDIAGNYSNLAGQLTSGGYTVVETSAGLNNVNLSNVDVIVVTITNAWNSTYTQAEINTIQSFVSGGGGLLLLCDESGLSANANVQGVAALFGVTCALDDSSTDIVTWNSHPISAGMGTLDVLAAGALQLSSPAAAVGLDGSRVVVAAANLGSGRTAVVGDINWAINSYLGNSQNSLFADNTFAWLAAGGGGPQCGNGNLEGNEACDDGNTTDCDGCRADCSAIETGCGDTFLCGTEACDDGNTVDCDGCAGDCSAVESGCGDGVVCGNEVCDDGNNTPCDGCAADCGLIETGCGDGFICGTEACDDGNTAACDGCSATCNHETGCGDGSVCGAEECDDGNNADGDGCSGNCQDEGAGGGGTSSGTGGGTSSGTGGGTSSGTGGGTSSGSSDDDSSGDSGGCGYGAQGPSRTGRSAAITLLALLALAIRRRRRQQR